MALSGSQIVSLVLAFFAVIRALFPEFGETHVALSGYGVATDLHVWTLFTAGFYESLALLIFVDIALTFAVGRYLEASSWSTGDLIRYVIQTNVLVMISTVFTSIAGYFVTRQESIFFGVVGGFSGVLGAYAVALWQKIGDSPLLPQISALGFLKYQHLPMISVISSIVLFLVDADPSRIMLTCYGILYSWIYLRFLRKNPELGGMLGDLREEFAFDAMFPTPVRPVVAVVSTIVLKIANGLGFLKREPLLPVSNTTQDDDDDFREYSTSTKLAEERRQLAIKAIDEKIAQIQNNMKKKPSNLQPNSKKTDASSLATRKSPQLAPLEKGDDDEKEPLVKKPRRDAQA